jgi:hypothetical protein
MPTAPPCAKPKKASTAPASAKLAALAKSRSIMKTAMTGSTGPVRIAPSPS